jgi:hypothetical protein
MKPMSREVEYYRLWNDHTWDTAYVEIPADTPEEQIEQAVRAAIDKLAWKRDAPVITGIYHIESNEDLEFRRKLELDPADTREER